MILLALLLPLALLSLVMEGGADDVESGSDVAASSGSGSGESDQVSVQQVLGSNGNDLLRAEDVDTIILGFDGDDTLAGGSGHDLMDGGKHNDYLEGGSGLDIMGGAAGSDTLHGGADNDIMLGGRGADVLLGQTGDDYIVGGLGADQLEGGAGNDYLISGNSDFRGGGIGQMESNPVFELAYLLAYEDDPNLFETGSIQDILAHPAFEGVDTSQLNSRYDQSADTLVGGAGADVMMFESGDRAIGGEGTDLFVASGRAPDDVMIIEDFDASEDVIGLEFGVGDTAPALAVADDGDDAVVLYDGEVALRVLGAQGQVSLDDIRVFVVDRSLV